MAIRFDKQKEIQFAYGIWFEQHKRASAAFHDAITAAKSMDEINAAMAAHCEVSNRIQRQFSELIGD